ncbi:MAG TPA: hypothetical protein DD435_16835 [Cyanobacteria bacterium UBA8530]|nr:hypothetical protein [Cyanobacteria bacterium UBA8530]
MEAVQTISKSLLAAVISVSLHHPGMPNWAPSNFDKVNDGLYRGGKIEDFAQLKRMRDELGISGIVNLAKDSLGPKGDNEILWAEKLQMAYFPCYLGTEPPSPSKWAKIKEFLKEGKVYVHCRHGADRTGAIVARYRVEVDEWKVDQSYREARKYGFKPWLSSLKKWIGVER